MFFVFREGLRNGVEVNLLAPLPTSHSCRFETFLRYCLKDTLNGSAHKCDVCGYRRHPNRRNVIRYLFVRVTIRKTVVSLSCSVYELKAGCA